MDIFTNINNMILDHCFYALAYMWFYVITPQRGVPDNSVHHDRRFGPGRFGPLQPTQTDNSAHLIKTQGCRDGWFGPLHTSSRNLRMDDSANILLDGKPLHIRRPFKMPQWAKSSASHKEYGVRHGLFLDFCFVFPLYCEMKHLMLWIGPNHTWTSAWCPSRGFALQHNRKSAWDEWSHLGLTICLCGLNGVMASSSRNIWTGTHDLNHTTILILSQMIPNNSSL